MSIQAKQKHPAKSKAQAIREAIKQLQGDGRDVTTATILALLPGFGVKDATAKDINYSTPWRELREMKKSGLLPTPASRPAPVEEAEPVETRPERNGISKGDAVRQALATLGADAKPKAVIEHVKQTHGLDVSAQTVSNLMASQGAPTKRRGRPRKVEAVVVTVSEVLPPRKAAAGDISLEDIRAVKELTERIGAEKVMQLAEVLA